MWCEMMKFKITMLAALAVLAIPFAAQAQETQSYESLKVSCESGAECQDFGVNFQQGDEVAQTRRTRTRRTRRSSSDSKAFAGATLGLSFPGEIDDSIIDPGTGFGGSIFGGYNFTDLISAEAEASLGFGSNDEEVAGGQEIDGSYTLFTIFVGPRFTYTIDKGNDRSPYVFATPSIGFGALNIGDDVGDRIEDAGTDSSGGGFGIQGKIGAGYPVSDKLDLIGQAKYSRIFSIVEVADGDDEGLGTFGIDAGLSYKF